MPEIRLTLERTQHKPWRNTSSQLRASPFRSSLANRTPTSKAKDQTRIQIRIQDRIQGVAVDKMLTHLKAVEVLAWMPAKSLASP